MQPKMPFRQTWQVEASAWGLQGRGERQKLAGRARKEGAGLLEGGGLGPGLLSPRAGGGGGGGGGLLLLLLEQIVQDLLQPENVHVEDQKWCHNTSAAAAQNT